MANTQLPARLLDTSAVPALNVTGDLTVDTTTLKVDTTNNRVGIGEPSPSGKLSIKSSGTSTYPLWIKASDGSNAFMLYEHGSGEIEIDLRKADGSSPKFKVSETGNLGIGIAAPTHRLHVLSTENKGFLLDRNTSNSPANLNEFSSFYSLSIKNRAGGSYLNFGGNGANTSIQATDGAGSATAKTISLNPYGGSVGIGTTSPDTLLNLKDTGGIEVRLEADSNNNGQEDCFIRFYTDGKTQEGIAGMDNNNSSTLFSGNTENAMVFGTVSNLPVVLATNNTERMLIASDGAVSVVTDTSASPVGNSHAQLTVKTSVNANPAYAVLSFDSGVGRLGVIEGRQRAGGSAGYGHISTIVNNGQSGSGAMVRAITANYTGKVGIGKGHNITPDMNLEVYAYNETSQWTSSGSYHGGTQAFAILSNSPPAPVAGDYGYYKEFWYYMSGNTSHTMIWDNSDSYFNAEIQIVAACTNGGSNNNVFARGFWANNHTSHNFSVIEGMTQTSSSVGSVIVNGASGGIGALANGNTFTFTASQGTNASNSGKLTLVHSYPGGSFYGAKIRLRVYFGQFNGHSSSS